MYILESSKICNLKKREQGLKVKEVCKQVRDQIVWKQFEDTAQGFPVEWK